MLLDFYDKKPKVSLKMLICLCTLSCYPIASTLSSRKVARELFFRTTPARQTTCQFPSGMHTLAHKELVHRPATVGISVPLTTKCPPAERATPNRPCPLIAPLARLDCAAPGPSIGTFARASSLLPQVG